MYGEEPGLVIVQGAADGFVQEAPVSVPPTEVGLV